MESNIYTEYEGRKYELVVGNGCAGCAFKSLWTDDNDAICPVVHGLSVCDAFDDSSMMWKEVV